MWSNEYKEKIYKWLEEHKEFKLAKDLYYDHIQSEIFDGDEKLVEYLKENGMVKDGEVILPAGTKLTYRGNSNPWGAGYIYFELNDCGEEIPDICFANDFYYNEDLLDAIGCNLKEELGIHTENQEDEKPLTEAPDEYGLPTDDELADEEERERAELEKKLAAKRAKRDAEKKAAIDKEEADKKAAQEREQKLASVKDKLEEIKTLVAKENEDTLFENLFNILVPDRGPAETLAGELIRAWMRVMYRSWNDGDVFFEGYGLETCGPEAAFVCENANEEISQMIRDLAEDCYDEATRKEIGSDYTNYDNKCTEIAQKLADSILGDYAETLVTSNKFDCNKEYKGEDYWSNYIPKYEYELYIAEDVKKHIDAYNISLSDVVREVETWLDGSNVFYGAEVDAGWSDSVTISNLTIDGYREIESWDSHNNIWNEYIEELNNEYGDPDDVEDEDEYDDDFDESLNERIDNIDPIEDDDYEELSYKGKLAKRSQLDLMDSQEKYIYLFPICGAMEPISDCEDFNLTLLGKNYFEDEKNYVVKGSIQDLEEYADYLGYELHPDYLYVADDFGGDIIPLDEALQEGLNNTEREEYFQLCKEIGIKGTKDLESFMKEVGLEPGCLAQDLLKALRDYRAELGPDFKIMHEKIELAESDDSYQPDRELVGYVIVDIEYGAKYEPVYFKKGWEKFSQSYLSDAKNSHDDVWYDQIITEDLDEVELYDSVEKALEALEDFYGGYTSYCTKISGKNTLLINWACEDNWDIDSRDVDVYKVKPLYHYTHSWTELDEQLKEENATSEEKCESSRFFVYDDNGEVISDSFEYYEDAYDFAIERGYNTVKQHCYYRETPDSTLKPLGDPKVIADNISTKLDEKLVDKQDGWIETETWNNVARDFDDLDYEIKNCVKQRADNYQELANEIRDIATNLEDCADEYEEFEESESENLDEDLNKEYKLESPFNKFYRPMTEEDMMEITGMTFEEMGSPVEEADDSFTSLGWYIAKDEYFNNMTNIYEYLSDNGIEIAELVKEEGKEKPFLAYTVNNRVFPITKDELEYLFWDDEFDDDEYEDDYDESLNMNSTQADQVQEEPTLCPHCKAELPEDGVCPECSKPEAELIEAKSDNKFEVLYYTELDDDGNYSGDPVTIEFDTRKEAIAFYKKHSKDEDKYGWWVTERDEDWEVVKDIITEGKLNTFESKKINIKTSFTEEEVKQYAEELSRITYEKGSYVDVYPNFRGDECYLCAYIEDGDWKHDHLAFENTVRRYFKEKGITVKINGEVVDSEDTFSDCYSVSYEIKKVI